MTVDSFLSEHEQKTLNYYNSQSGNWAGTHNISAPDSYWQKEIGIFHTLLPKGKILEIGSGVGREASIFTKLGYDYVGIDASAGLIDIARENNPQTSFLIMNATDLRFSQNEFDGIWSSATLIHIPKEKIEKTLSEIRRIMKNGGIGFLSMLEGEGEKEDDEDSTGRWFSYYQSDEFETMLVNNRFQTVNKYSKTGPGKRNWLVYFFKAI